jgi:putative polyketide hydroxylase
VPRSRAAVRACRPGVFLEGDSARSSTGQPVGSAATPRSPGRPQPGLEAVAAVLHGQAGLAPYSIYLSHNERHPIELLSLYMQQRPLPASAPAWVKASRCPTHRLRGGDDGLPVYRSSAVLGASEDILPLLPQGAIAGEPGTRAPHVAVTFGGREISTIDLYGQCFVLLAGANGAAWISAAERVMQRLGVPLDVYIASVWSWEVLKLAAAAAHRLEMDGALLVRPDDFVAWRTEAAAEEEPERTLERVLCRLLRRTHPARHRKSHQLNC